MPMQHFDVDAIERQMRADIAGVHALNEAAVARGEDVDLPFMRTQRFFDEARVQILLAPMKAENAGNSRDDVAAAAGVQLGQAIAGIVRAFNPQQREAFSVAIADAILTAPSASDEPVETADGAYVARRFPGQQAGRA